MSGDVGGDPPCWSHLPDGHADPAPADQPSGAVVVDLGTTDTRGPAGVVWNLPHSGDLDANLVRLHADGVISAHVNDDVDVLLSVIAGRGEVSIDGITHELRSDIVALVPKGARREIRAGADGITYLSIHRRRPPLAVDTTPRDRSDP